MPIFSAEQGGSTVMTMENIMLTATVLSIASAQGSVRIHRSTDAGVSWNSPVVINSPSANVAPSLCGPDASGRIFVWYMTTSNNLALKYSDDQGKTWVAGA
jgi:Neuraminidase (sialidase)